MVGESDEHAQRVRLPRPHEKAPVDRSTGAVRLWGRTLVLGGRGGVADSSGGGVSLFLGLVGLGAQIGGGGVALSDRLVGGGVGRGQSGGLHHNDLRDDTV